MKRMKRERKCNLNLCPMARTGWIKALPSPSPLHSPVENIWPFSLTSGHSYTTVFSELYSHCACHSPTNRTPKIQEQGTNLWNFSVESLGPQKEVPLHRVKNSTHRGRTREKILVNVAFIFGSGHFAELGANFKAIESGWATSRAGSSILWLEERMLSYSC